MKTVIRPETEMKDSGIEWIGDIPKDWNSAPIKVNFDIYAGATPSSNNPIYWDGDIAWITPADYKTEDKYVSCGKRHISQDGYDNCSAILVPANSIIFSKRAPIGTVAISKNELCTNQGCLSCVSKDDSNIEFYYYAMSIATEEFELKGSGTTFKEISLANFKNFRFAVPPLSEQQAIADYLDETCFKIDEIIAEAKASIDEYKELRIAIIDDFTICGFNKTKLKYISKKIGDGLHGTPQYSDNGTVAFINGTNIGDEKITIKSNTNFVSIDEAEKHKNELNSQTILISLNGTIGNSSLYDGENIILGKSAGYITLKNNVCREYVRYCLENSVTKEAFDLSLNGTTIPNLSLNTLRNTEICLPDYSVQKQLAKTIKKMIIKMDSLIAEKESLINDLEAYKKSLIYEVVTGKRRVV